MEPAGTTTKAFRISEDLKTRIEEVQGPQGAVEFWEKILSALSASAEQAEKPATKEAETVRRALAQVEQVVLAALRLADETGSQALTEVEKVKTAARRLDQEAQEQKKALEAELAAARDGYRKSAEEITRLQTQIESVADLKALWQEKETGHLERIAALDAEANEARQLKELLAKARAELAERDAKAKDLEHALELQARDLSAARTEAQSAQEVITEMKADLKSEREAARNALDGLKTELDAQRKDHTQGLADLAAARAQVEGLRESTEALREEQQKDRQALEEERNVHGKTRVELATALAQSQAAFDALEREREQKSQAESPKPPDKRSGRSKRRPENPTVEPAG